MLGTLIYSAVKLTCKRGTRVHSQEIGLLNCGQEQSVTEVKIPNYQVRRNGRGFWEPTPKMRLFGFRSVPCGPDGPGAWKIAQQWQHRWEATRKGEAPSPAMVTAQNLSPHQTEVLTVYPPRSIGEGFRRFRNTDEWKNKKPRTREDWWRVWRWVKPVFGDCDPRTVTLEDIDAWRSMIEQTVSLREAHRCIKIWRALWRKLAASGYCVRDADPALGITNRSKPCTVGGRRTAMKVRAPLTAQEQARHAAALDQHFDQTSTLEKPKRAYRCRCR
jgi:hypothetical protein